MVFDSWGGVLADGAFQTFSLAYTQRVLAQLKRERRRQARAAHRLHQGRRAVAGGDRGVGRRRRRRRLDRPPRHGAPARRRRASRCKATSTRRCCSRGAEAIRREVAARPRQLRRRGRRDGRNGHIFNLGHGISQHAPPENVAVLVDAVHALVARPITVPRRDRIHERRDREVLRVSERSGLDLSPRLDSVTNACRDLLRRIMLAKPTAR